MRVLIMPEWYPWDDRPTFGVFCREQARAVARRHDVVVLSCRPDAKLHVPFRTDDQVEDGLRTLRLRFRTTRVPKVGGASKLAGCIAVLGGLRRSGWAPDVIHAHEYQAGRTALMLARLARAPVVVSEHYTGFALGTVPPRERERARRVFERAAFVCPDSRDLVRWIAPLAPAATFESVPNSVDTDVFRPADASPTVRHHGRPLRLVSVGALIERKGHRYLLEAMGRCLPGRDLELDIIGGGPLRDELPALARSLGLEGRVRFHGPQSHDGVAAVLREADVFVLPSLWENTPCALLEAMACGLPSVATRVGDVPELVAEGAGVVIGLHSAEELAAGIVAVESRLDRYDRVGLAARTAATFGNAAICNRWTAVYEAALTRAPSSP